MLPDSIYICMYKASQCLLDISLGKNPSSWKVFYSLHLSLCVSELSFLCCLWDLLHRIQCTHHVLLGSWMWHLVISYGHSLLPTLSSNRHHHVFSSGVLHNFRRLLNSFFILFCKILPWCDIRENKSFSGYTAGLLWPLFMFSSVCLVPVFLFFLSVHILM